MNLELSIRYTKYNKFVVNLWTVQISMEVRYVIFSQEYSIVILSLSHKAWF